MIKFKYIGKVLPRTSLEMLMYLSDGKVNENGLVETKHILSGDVDYWAEDQFNKWFEMVK